MARHRQGEYLHVHDLATKIWDLGKIAQHVDRITTYLVPAQT